MLLSHITDTKPREKSRVTQKLPPYRQHCTLETARHGLNTALLFLSWILLDPHLSLHSHMQRPALTQPAQGRSRTACAFSAEQITLKAARNHRSGLPLSWLKWNDETGKCFCVYFGEHKGLPCLPKDTVFWQFLKHSEHDHYPVLCA